MLDLAAHLENDRGWVRIKVGRQIMEGDIGVVIVGHGSSIHHIYVVLDASNQTDTIVADNQGRGYQPSSRGGRRSAGRGTFGRRDNYFLRAP